MADQIELYTDGACKGNPGRGGWGAVLRTNGVQQELYGGHRETTNNRMELQAVIEGLATLSERAAVTIVTDSKYVKDGMQKWIINWKKNGWKTSAKKPVKNSDLWKRLDDLVAGHDVTWKWVKGHSGHPENELADDLANRGAAEAR